MSDMTPKKMFEDVFGQFKYNNRATLMVYNIIIQKLSAIDELNKLPNPCSE